MNVLSVNNIKHQHLEEECENCKNNNQNNFSGKINGENTYGPLSINNNYHEKVSKPKGKYTKFTKFITQNAYVIIFIFMIFLDEFFCLKYFSYAFSKSKERQAFFIISLILYVYIMALYIRLITIKPAQTCLEEFKEKYPNRIISEKILNDFDRVCEFCNKAKHIRSSHCRTCQVCVLKRDHHCPWTNNCVGYKNINFFLCYLIWMLIYGVLFFQGFIRYFNHYENFSYIVMPIMIFCVVFSLGVFIGVSNLVFSNLICFVNEFTFLEQEKSNRIEKYYVLCTSKYIHLNSYNPYNKGWLFNLRCCFGPSLFHVFFPLLKQVNTNIDEENLSFYKNCPARRYDIIKGLSGVKYNSLDQIIQSQYDKANPLDVMEYARTHYNKQNIQII